MKLRDIVEDVASGVICIVFLNSNNEIIGKGSGFVSHGHLVTNNHVFAMGHRSAKVWLRNSFDSDTDLSQGTLLGGREFCESLVTGSDKNNYDYAVLDIQALKNRGLYEFKMQRPDSFKIGDDISLLGFPLD